MSVRIGMVGLGQRGLQHLKSLWHIDGARVVALCDPFPDNLEETKLRSFVAGDFKLEGIATVSRFSDLRLSDMDALYFAIPPGRHDGEVVEAARAGLHLFIEKPASLYIDEALEMERAIAEAGVLTTVGFNQRHDARNIVVRDFLDGKRLVMMTTVTNGTLESHSVKHTHTEELGGPASRVWAANQAWSGSTVVEAGIHPLDLVRFWAGDIVWTRADYIHRPLDDIEEGHDNPNGYAVTCGLESGMIYNLLLTRLRKTFYGDDYQDIAWERGHLKFESDGPVAYYYDGPYPPDSRPGNDDVRHPLPVPQGEDGTRAISRAFVRAVADADETHLMNTFSPSMNSLAAVLAANVSDQLDGRKVALDDLLYADEFAGFRERPVRERPA